MAIKKKYEYRHEHILRDARPLSVKIIDGAKEPQNLSVAYFVAALTMYSDIFLKYFSDLIFFFMVLYFFWQITRQMKLPFKLPKSAQRPDPNYIRPDGSKGMSDGILYLGNDRETGEEIWFTNNDARTHCLYLGTTGSGKTFGLKSFACNALTWASGFIYIDGKADTDLWSTLSAMARRFGRDDDILIMNYMTGNVGGRVPSNTLNPFSSGSASYLTNMLVSLMPDAEGDNAMWKDRAVALMSSLMPCLVWKRDNQNVPLSIGVIRHYLTFKAVIKISRDKAIPEHFRNGIKGYLNELPGYVDTVFDDEGNEKPNSPDAAAADTSVPRQQHGYLSMQFTRSMQSLGDDYGFIFDTQAADIDMLDVVLNRRILVVLIPALEKSGDETANLGKIISSTLKGMMGATLGNTVEGDTATAIDNKPTNSATPFIAIFDEVGYYTAQGMAVMAAQARSLGFSLIFAAQDMPALEKRVKEEARSITANCNIKLFGKLEDPTQTKDFFEKTVGSSIVTEVSGYQRPQGGGLHYSDSMNASVQIRARVHYDALKGFTEGRAVCSFGNSLSEMQVYNSDIGHAHAMRVQRFLPIPAPSEEALAGLRTVDTVLKRLRNPKWNPEAEKIASNRDIDAMATGFSMAKQAKGTLPECGIAAVARVAEVHETIKPEDAAAGDSSAAAPAAAAPRVTPAEQAAITQVEEKASTGPLSWGAIIGGPGAESAPVPGISPPPPVAPSAPAAAPIPVDAPPQAVSWMSIIGAADMPAVPMPPPAPPPVTGTPPVGTVPLDMLGIKAPPPVTEDEEQRAREQGVEQPLSWASIIGADDKKDDKS